MDNANFIDKLAAQFGQSASVKNVFGDPVQAGDKTIIPVAQIAYGLGGGYGQGNKKLKQAPAAISVEPPTADDKGMASGQGAGGGIYAKPKGVYEISATGTRFIPANNARSLLMGIALGFVIKALFFSKKKK